MRGIIEVGVVLFVIYLFMQWEKNGGAAGPVTITPPTFFNEFPGDVSEGSVNEGGPSRNPPVSGSGASGSGTCGCGGH